MRGRNRYNDKFRAGAVVMLEAAGYPDKKGALLQVSKKTGAPSSTLSRWFKERNNPAPPELVTEKRFDLIQSIKDELIALFPEMAKTRQDAHYRDLTTSAAILIDKLQLLENKPTENNVTRIIVQNDTRDNDTFARHARRTNRGAEDSRAIQRVIDGPTVGQNGTGHKISD